MSRLREALDSEARNLADGELDGPASGHFDGQIDGRIASGMDGHGAGGHEPLPAIEPGQVKALEMFQVVPSSLESGEFRCI